MTYTKTRDFIWVCNFCGVFGNISEFKVISDKKMSYPYQADKLEFETTVLECKKCKEILKFISPIN